MSQAQETGIILTAFLFIEIIMILPVIMLFRFGGPKIVFWRMTKTRFGSARIIDHDGTPFYKSFRMTEVITKSPPHVFIKNSQKKLLPRYLDPLNYTKRWGSPCWEFHIDNSLPIPITRGFRDVILDPVSVEAAMHTDLLRRLWNLGKENKEKKNPFPALRALAIVAAILAAIYLFTVFVK